MSALIQGIGIGLLLSILVGPIIFLLIQTGIERGFRAGIAAASGIWISDLIYMLLVLLSLDAIRRVTQTENFELYLGTFGGILLILFGLGMILSKPKASFKTKTSSRSYLGLFIKGFSINTFNPFTIFFWISIISTTVVKNDWTSADTYAFLGGIILTIMATDSGKVIAAKYVRKWLTPHHIVLARRVSGSALLIFGVVLIGRVVFT